MGQPLPYYIFILGLLLVFSAMGGIMYFSYRKCAKLRDIVRFVVAPDEEYYDFFEWVIDNVKLTPWDSDLPYCRRAFNIRQEHM